VKHFPGLGRILGNTDFTGTDIDDNVTTWNDPYLQAFSQAIQAHPAMVMVSLATYSQIDPVNQAAFSPIIITQVLRGDLGWDGVVISESLGAAAVKHMPAEDRGVAFIAAGGDIAIFTTTADLQAAASGIKQRMESDPAFATQVDQAVLRVLTAKQQAGLIPR